MSQLLINVGSQPNAGDGDPLRIAFSKINENFAELYNQQLLNANGAVITSYVSSVAGKTGNVQLTVNDVQGAVTSGYVQNLVTAEVNSQINGILDAAPANLDTLRELAGALHNDASIVDTIMTQLGDKLSKTTGGQISGPLLVAQDPTQNLQVATKQYVDNLVVASTGFEPASPIRLGGVIVGDNLVIDTVGKLDAVVPVKSVAGKTGDVTLSVTDVQGAASSADVVAGLALKADTSSVYTKAEVDALLLNITANWVSPGNDDWGLVIDSVSNAEDFGSI